MGTREIVQQLTSILYTLKFSMYEVSNLTLWLLPKRYTYLEQVYGLLPVQILLDNPALSIWPWVLTDELLQHFIGRFCVHWLILNARSGDIGIPLNSNLNRC